MHLRGRNGHSIVTDHQFCVLEEIEPLEILVSDVSILLSFS
jgi:hypothetical protein